LTQSPTVQLEAEPIFKMEAVMASARMIPGGPFGDMVAIDVSGGKFHGPRVSGKVMPSGGDWVSVFPQGARVNVRLLLETDDGVPLLLEYRGVARVRDGKQRSEVGGLITAPADSKYAWLNHVHLVGFGGGADGVAHYDFYQLL